MRMVTRIIAVLMAVVVLVVAQTQIATITSDSPFQLRGVNVAPGQGVPSWPVMPGDTLQAGQTPLTLTFPDGSTIVLAPGATAKVDLAGKTPVLKLESGAAHYSLKTLSSVKLVQLKATISPKDLVGDLQIGANHLANGWWTPLHTTAVVAAAGGAAAFGIAKAKSASCKGNQQGNNNCQ